MYSNGSFVSDANRQIIPIIPASIHNIVLFKKRQIIPKDNVHMFRKSNNIKLY